MELGVNVPSLFDAGEPALLDSAHRAVMNQEVFFFGEHGDRERFLRDPWRHAGLLTDPVNRVRFRPQPESPRLEHVGRVLYFASAATRDRFAAMPDSFPIPAIRMMPVMEGEEAPAGR